MAKNGNSGKLAYNWLAKNAPSNRTSAGSDNWRVVSGQPTDQKTSKSGPGAAKNDGKKPGSY